MLAFSTAQELREDLDDATQSVTVAHGDLVDAVFDATVEATEEAIANALTTATTTRGWDGHLVHAIPLDRLKTALNKARP
jgi:D-aminopeptidase